MTTEKKRYPERSRVGGILTRCVGIFLLILVIFLLGDNILREIDNRLSAVVLRRSDCLEHLSGLSFGVDYSSLPPGPSMPSNGRETPRSGVQIGFPVFCSICFLVSPAISPPCCAISALS